MLVIILPADVYGHETCSNMEEETHIQDVWAVCDLYQIYSTLQKW
jgi:hypothetical protein